MAEIVNLRQVRKRKAREEKEHHAAEQRAKHGLSKANRRLHAAKKSLEARRLDETMRSEVPAKDAD